MCRWLFNEVFFEGKEFLHSDPNHPGIEVCPVFCKENGKWISFQSKFFSSIDYGQIQHSADMTVKYYAGKLDVVYLYCNKDVTTTSESYISVEKTLNDAGIELCPITNQEILIQVMRYDKIAHYYFNQITLTSSWLNKKLALSLSALGPRYDAQFNVSTESERNFNYFLCSNDSIERVNQKKNSLVTELKEICQRQYEQQGIINRIIGSIDALDDISNTNFSSCFEWKTRLRTQCAEQFNWIQNFIEMQKYKREEAYEKHDQSEVLSITRCIRDFEDILDIYENGFLNDEAEYLSKQTIIIKGDAGVGKSQMLANEAEKLSCSNHAVILLLGFDFINDHSITQQIAEILDIDYTFDILLSKLEGKAVLNNTYSYIFIDAINESVNHNVWKTHLASLLGSVRNYPHVKVAISVRNGYESLVFNDTLINMIESKQIPCLIHEGFWNDSFDATLKFLNHYSIPFLPYYSLQAEMRNPLFLKMFCQTYSPERDFDIESFFVNSRNLEQLKQHVESEQFNNGDVFPDISMCQLYNREYAWSTGYSDILREEWYDYQIESAEYHVVKHTIEMPKFYVAYDDIEDDLFSLAEQKYEEKIPNEIYHIPIMPSHTTFQWEEGYDASHDQSVSFDVPCKAIIDHFKLQQKQIDGYYYSDEDELVCFDGRLANMQTGFIIRSDYLKKFLDDTNLSLIWICTAEKQFFTAANSSDQEWSTWRGFLTWSNENVDGAIQFIGFGT